LRALVQRVSGGSVAIGGERRAAIDRGYVILLGVRTGDSREDADYLAGKCAGLRVMEDETGKMNLGLKETGSKALVVSQFTLYGDARKGNRPGFTEAAPPAEALPLYEAFVAKMRELLGRENVLTGEFQAMMQVTIVNDGPVTILIESPNHNQ
jgi:D-tyrosyl-tRNA(Tyr) deacylase